MRTLTTILLPWIVIMLNCGSSHADELGWYASGPDGAVAAGGEDAVRAGISMLEQGGNAADAAVATLLALSITDYGMFAIGGEVPLMYFDARKGEVKVISGLGCAPLDQDAIDWYYRNGIPGDGGMKAAPVPGAVSLCFATLKQYGTMSFEEVVTPSLALLDAGGETWYGNLAGTFRKLTEAERNTSGTRQDKLQTARDRFYTGDIADELESYYIANGGFLRKSDLAAYESRIEDPIAVTYRGYTVYKCNTWTQGPILSQTLRILEGFDLNDMGHLSADYIHVLAEALKLGFADRDMYYGDQVFADVPLQALLSDRYTELRRTLIDMSTASPDVRPGDPRAMKALKDGGTYTPGDGGTTTCVVTDRWGNMVAATPSANPPYSVCEPLGFSFGNRLRSLNTIPGHPNRIEPGKRPRITLTPTMVMKDGECVMAISVAGGDMQDQTTLNILLNHIEFGMMPAESVTAPRFHTSHHEDSFNPDADRRKTYVQLRRLTLNDTIGQAVGDELGRRGHEVMQTSGTIATPVMLYRDPDTGISYVAGDPRAGRHAAAIDDPTATDE
jgi:gamma-glutamyltranspeptidase / glutathione hydrolase